MWHVSKSERLVEHNPEKSCIGARYRFDNVLSKSHKVDQYP